MEKTNSASFEDAQDNDNFEDCDDQKRKKALHYDILSLEETTAES